MLVLFQPANIVITIWANSFYLVPESRRVVHVEQVTDLVSDHVVDNAIGRQHNQPIVLQHSLIAS